MPFRINHHQVFRFSLWMQAGWNTLLWAALVWLMYGSETSGEGIKDTLTQVELSQAAFATWLIGALATFLWPYQLLRRHQTLRNSTRQHRAGHSIGLWLWWLLNLAVPLGLFFTLLQIWSLWADTRASGASRQGTRRT